MPYMKVTVDGKKKVYKKGPDGKPMGEALGTHDSDEDADAQITAINMQEHKKESDHTKCGDEMYVPWGVTSFAELEAVEVAQETAHQAHKLTGYFSQLAQNIMGNPEMPNKAQALARLAMEYVNKVGAAMKGKETEPAPETKENPQPTPTPENSLFIWKENGTYRWIAAYSNNYRDDDNPAEIISTESHKEFDEALEKGEYPMPELWPWHIPYRAGEANLHTFDPETGFTLAAGTFDEGKEWVAEGMIKAGWDGVSHGMPSQEIQRSDDKDKTIITRHRSREISPLPMWAAANKLSFNIISKENDMSIPAHKREEFIKAFGADKVDEIEKALEGRAKEAQEAGIEQKETATPEASPPTTEVQTDPQKPAINPQDLAQAIASAVMAAVAPIAEEVKALRVEVKELQKSDAEKVAEKAASTPAASLEALVMERLGGGLFGKDTEVDGRSSLAKSKPTQNNDHQKTGLFFDSWLQPGQ